MVVGMLDQGIATKRMTEKDATHNGGMSRENESGFYPESNSSLKSGRREWAAERSASFVRANRDVCSHRIV